MLVGVVILNKWVFSLHLNNEVDCKHLNLYGRLFHSLGEIIENADSCLRIILLVEVICCLNVLEVRCSREELYSVSSSVR